MVPGRGVGKFGRSSAAAGEDGDGLEVVGVGKEVEECEARKSEAVVGETDGVPEQGRGVAGNISDRANQALANGFDENRRQTSPWGVQDDQVACCERRELRPSGVGRSISAHEARLGARVWPLRAPPPPPASATTFDTRSWRRNRFDWKKLPTDCRSVRPDTRCST